MPVPKFDPKTGYSTLSDQQRSGKRKTRQKSRAQMRAEVESSRAKGNALSPPISAPPNPLTFPQTPQQHPGFSTNQQMLVTPHILGYGSSGPPGGPAWPGVLGPPPLNLGSQTSNSMHF